MNKVFNFFLVFFFSFVLLVGCEKETILEVSQPSLTFTDQGGSQTITFSTNKEWTVSVSGGTGWCTVSPSSGNEDVKSITLTVIANDTYDDRSATITIRAEELTKTINIQQNTNLGLIISKTSYDLTNAAQTIETQIKYNLDYDIIIPDADKSWIVLSEGVNTKALIDKTIRFSILKNETYINRESSITFKQKDGPLSGTINVKQAQMNHIEVSPKKDSIAFDGGELEFTVKSNINYDILVPQASSWITVGSIVKGSTVNGLTEYIHKFTIKENEEITSRNSNLEVKTEYETLNSIFTISQGPQPVIEFADQYVKIVCINKFDTNGDGKLTYKEAASVKDINKYYTAEESVFAAYAPYVTSFNELQYFTSLQSIGGYTFARCTKLKSIILPNSVKTIGISAFSRCSSLEKILIPDSVTSLGATTFTGCTALKDVTIGKGLTLLGYGVFRGCTSLEEIVIPDNIKSLGLMTFAYCTNLKNITLPEGMVTIGGSGSQQETFQSCQKLSSITIPSTVTSIGGHVFGNCTSLTTIYSKPTKPPTGGNLFYSSDSNILDNITIYVPQESVEKYKTSEYWFPYSSKITGYNY